MKTLALASLAALTVLAAGCDHMSTRSNDHMAAESGSSTATSAKTASADFDRLDANHDGFLSKDELLGSPALAQDFAKIDTNGDGKVSPDEWKAWGHH